MGYWLLDHRNPHGDHFYRSRRRPVVGVVVHCTAGLEDLDLVGADASAERTARYAATTNRSVSWHSGSDSDSVVELLPADHTAFHVRGYNSSTYGHEISKRDMSWADEPPAWVDATLRQAAGHLGGLARKLGIPLKRIGSAQLDRAVKTADRSLGGFIGHSELDPARRSDPGRDFPWDRFLALAGGQQVPVVRPPQPSPEPAPDADPWLAQGARGLDVRRAQGMLVAHGHDLAIDGAYGPATASVTRRFQLRHGLAVDGVIGPATWLGLEAGRPLTRQPQRGLPARLVQALLSAAEHRLTIDGIFGPGTDQHLRTFQQARNLTADGIAGTRTWRALLGR